MSMPTTISCPKCPRGLLDYSKPLDREIALWWCPRCWEVYSADDLLAWKRQDKLVQIPTAARRLLPAFAALGALPVMHGGAK